MKKHSGLRVRLTIIMLLISLVPTLLVTTVSTLSTYFREYRNTVTVNTEGMSQAGELIHRFTEDMKRVFYAMEFSSDYKRAISDWHLGERNYENSLIIRDALLSQLNQNSDLKSIYLISAGTEYGMIARRSGVEILDGAPVPILERASGMQTNLFFKGDSKGDLIAVHNIHRFVDRTLLAQLQVEIDGEYLSQVLGRLRLYGEERIFLVNDRGEVVLSLQDETGEDDEVPREVQEIRRIDEARNEDKPVSYLDRDGTLIFSTFRPEAKLGVVKYLPRRYLTAAAGPTIITGVSTGILSALVASILAVLLSRFISRPVEQLARRVRNIKLESLVLEPGGKQADEALWQDEVGLLEEHITLFIDQIRRLIKEEYAVKLRATSAQIEALQAQINPHFLHNTLQLIGSIALSREADEVYAISSSLSRIMRYTLNMQEHQVVLRQELQFLDLYLFIQNQRFHDRFRIEKVIEPEAQECRIPKLLLQPIVENAFQHGFSTQEGEWLLVLRARVENSFLIITVEDNGQGISARQAEELNRKLQDSREHFSPGGKHIGLQNVDARIKLLYGPGFGVFVSKSGEGHTLISLKLKAEPGVSSKAPAGAEKKSERQG